MSIHQFFSSNDDTNYFHSSSYGKIAHGDRIGSLGQRTFGERYTIEHNRKMVQRYHDSHVARRTVDEGGSTIDSGRSQESTELSSGRQEHGLAIPPRPVVPPPRNSGFHEPPARGYNPFS